MNAYTTRLHDVLDKVCKKIYGTEQAVHAVLIANPGLADQGEFLPAGLVIKLPDVQIAPVAAPQIKLWD